MDKEKVGANLEELWYDGTHTVPEVGDQFGGARTDLGKADIGNGFNRDHTLGIGAQGPKTSYNGLVDVISAAAKRNNDTMDRIGEHLAKTAQDFANTDAEIRRSFLAQGGKLDG